MKTLRHSAVGIVVAVVAAAQVVAGGSGAAAASPAPGSGVAAASPAASEVPATDGPLSWSPIDPAEVPFRYACADGALFTAADLASGQSPANASPPLLGWDDWRILHDDGAEIMLGRVGDPAAPIGYMLFERTAEGWRETGGGDCIPWARFDDEPAVGGFWVLDPTKPIPKPGSRRIHVRVTYTRACPAAVRMRSRPVLHLTADAVLIAMPVTTSEGDHCTPGRARRVVVRLPEPLGDRAIYDAGFLPIRQLWQGVDARSADRGSDVPDAASALDCDFRRSGQDSEVGHWEGDPGYASPWRAALAAIHDAWAVPVRGYREVGRDDSFVTYGYQNDDEVKVAVRVQRIGTAWHPERLATCRVWEFGTEAKVTHGVRLWANRRDRTIADFPGPGHCDWESARILSWHRPGATEELRTAREFVRDPRGVFRDRWLVAFLPSTTLPSDARFTGYRRKGWGLWMAADKSAMFVKRGTVVERWPKIVGHIGCA